MNVNRKQMDYKELHFGRREYFLLNDNICKVQKSVNSMLFMFQNDITITHPQERESYAFHFPLKLIKRDLNCSRIDVQPYRQKLSTFPVRNWSNFHGVACTQNELCRVAKHLSSKTGLNVPTGPIQSAQAYTETKGIVDVTRASHFTHPHSPPHLPPPAHP